MVPEWEYRMVCVYIYIYTCIWQSLWMCLKMMEIAKLVVLTGTMTIHGISGYVAYFQTKFSPNKFKRYRESSADQNDVPHKFLQNRDINHEMPRQRHAQVVLLCGVPEKKSDPCRMTSSGTSQFSIIPLAIFNSIIFWHTYLYIQTVLFTGGRIPWECWLWNVRTCRGKVCSTERSVSTLQSSNPSNWTI